MATIREIAKEAGVSAGAVSRILNNDSTLSVSPETRKLVMDTAAKLNYEKKPKKTAPPKANFTIGVVQWFSAQEELNDNYYLRTRQGVEDFCVRNGIKVVRIFRNETDIFDRLRGVNGLICLGKFSESEITDFIAFCPNTVFLDMAVDKYNITSLSMDFSNAVNQVLDYLTELGHSKIAFLGGTEFVGDGEKIKDARTSSFKKYMKQKKIDYKQYFKESSFNSDSGYEMMTELIDTGNLPTAVFAASDAIAFGAMRAILDHDLRIPEDISIIGFNDEDTCRYMTPPLTTIHAPAYDMGQHGANLVYVSSNLSIATPLKAKIPCSLVIRQSCKSISKNNK